jgi:hypothetical protein
MRIRLALTVGIAIATFALIALLDQPHFEFIRGGGKPEGGPIPPAILLGYLPDWRLRLIGAGIVLLAGLILLSAGRYRHRRR